MTASDYFKPRQLILTLRPLPTRALSLPMLLMLQEWPDGSSAVRHAPPHPRQRSPPAPEPSPPRTVARLFTAPAGRSLAAQCGHISHPIFGLFSYIRPLQSGSAPLGEAWAENIHHTPQQRQRHRRRHKKDAFSATACDSIQRMPRERR